MKLKEILESGYVQSAILLLIVVIGVFALWFGLKAALRAEYPLCGVASGSMEPTLKVSDIIIVQWVDPAEVNAAPAPEGDIIVFYDPTYSRDPNHLIVHRAVDKKYEGGVWKFTTKGDANLGEDHWAVPEDYLVGKVSILRVPLVGFITFLMRTPAGILIILPMLVVIIIDWIPLLKKHSES